MISDQKRAEFRDLYQESFVEYLSKPKGVEHLESYEQNRAQGRANFARIQSAAARGENITDGVLRLLLPHTESAAHRASGAWIHVAPAIQGDVRSWFEAAGWTRPVDWPHVAEAILRFISRCIDRPSELDEACREFSRLPYAKGFQTGMITPILNALRPDDFLIINNKSRRVVNYFSGRSFKQRLTDYPATNVVALALVEELTADILDVAKSSPRPKDLFDVFCHWLASIRKYAPVVGQGDERQIPTTDRDVQVTVPEGDELSSESRLADVDVEPRESHRIQGALAKMGAAMGFRVWVPRNDRLRLSPYVPNTLQSAFLDALPLSYDEVTIKTIEQIDVLWLRGRSMERAFEVEHTTAIYSGLLRMADLLALQPNMDIRLHIVAPDDRREKVLREIKRPVFSLLGKAPLYERCSFVSYSSIGHLCDNPHLAHMSDSILNEYEEFAAE